MSKEFNIKSSTIEKGLELVKDFINKLLGPAVEEFGLLLADRVKFVRYKQQINILLKAQRLGGHYLASQISLSDYEYLKWLLNNQKFQYFEPPLRIEFESEHRWSSSTTTSSPQEEIYFYESSQNRFLPFELASSEIVFFEEWFYETKHYFDNDVIFY